MQLRNNDGTPWVWWIGLRRLILLALVALVGFRYSFGLGWVGAGIAVGVAFGLAAALWGTFAWLNANGRPLRLPRRGRAARAPSRRRGPLAPALGLPAGSWGYPEVRISGETFVAAHFHEGAVGVEGPPVELLFAGSTNASKIKQNGVATRLASTTGADICADPSGYYVNYHSTEFPAGAIRGQLG